MPLVACAECTMLLDVGVFITCKRCRSLICQGCRDSSVHKCHPMRNTRIVDFNREKDTTTWLVHNLLPDIGWTLMHAPAGVGKTTLALQMCAALVEGVPFLGMDTVPTKCLYVQADSPPDEFREITKRVIPTSKMWSTVNVPNQSLTNPEYTLGLQQLAAKVKPGFVVFDSLYNLSGSNINTEKILIDINMMRQIAGGVNVPFLLIHHQPHEQSRAAGHNSLEANCSNNWCLLNNMLRIDKGRLVKTKQLLLDKDEHGLWSAKCDDMSHANDSVYTNVANMRNRRLL